MIRRVEIEKGPYGGEVAIEPRADGGFNWEWRPFSGGSSIGWARTKAQARKSALGAAERRHQFETVRREIDSAMSYLTNALDKLRDLESR